MKNKILFIFVALSILFCLSLASSEEVCISGGQPLKINTPKNFIEPCIDGTLQTGCTVTLGVINTNGSLLVSNGNMQDLGTGYYNYTFTPNSLGTIKLIKTGVKGTLNNTECEYREVTYTGDSIDGSKVTIYIIALIFLILFGIALTIMGIRLKTLDKVKDDGTLLQINKLKYVKPIIWGFVYSIVIASIFIVSNMAIAFLPNPMIGNLFFKIFQIGMIGGIIGMPICFLYLLVKLIQSKETQRLIERGVEIDTY